MTVVPGAMNDHGQGGKPQVEMRQFRNSVVVLAAALLFVLLLHNQTLLSMVRIWFRSETFLHGVLIFPISGWLIWRRWPELKTVDAHPWYPGLPVVVLVSLLWWLSDALGLQVGKQLMLIALLPAVVLLINGPSFTRLIAFPLAYLVFAVPFGEAAIPYLIDFTAFFTVEALQVTGFPVFREGAYFSIPAGNFEVAKACSGIRYLLASLALGTLYGYLIFRDLKKRLAFAAFALVLPVVANGLRAYGIVLLAHFSDMQIAVGVDHLIFGWIFFGLVMLLMFWAGDRVRDTDDGSNDAMRTPAKCERRVSVRKPTLLAAIVAVGGAAAGPALAATLSRVTPQLPAAGLPVNAGEWRAVAESSLDWHPIFRGASHLQAGTYQRNQQRVDLVVVRYDEQQQGVELVNSTNAVADPDQWQYGSIREREQPVPGSGPVFLRETELSDASRERLVWSWNEVNGEPVNGDFQTKAKELGSALRLRMPVSAAIVVSVTVNNDLATSRQQLGQFVQTSWQPIHDCLYPDSEEETDCFRRDRKLENKER